MQRARFGRVCRPNLVMHGSGRAYSEDRTPQRRPLRRLARPTEVLSVLVAIEFVVLSAVVVLLVPIEVAAPLIPLLLVLVISFQMYRS